MKLIYQIIMGVLLALSSISAYAGGIVMMGGGVAATGGGGGSCSATPFFEGTTDSLNHDTIGTSIWQAQMVPNATNRQICKVSINVENSNGSATNVTLEIRTAHNRGGTLLGDAKTVAVATGMNWTDYTWTSNYPETSGNIYINWLAATSGVWWWTDTKSGAILYLNEYDNYNNQSVRIRVYAME